jgi:molecular chaperone DnaJ
LSDAKKKPNTINMVIKLDGSGGFGGGGHGGMNMDDILEFGDIFGSAFGGGGGFERRRRSASN